jgi:putative nucleotidyltransferase with HDIG domain
LENLRILLIDDDEAMLRYFREKLIVEGGYSVVFKSTIHESLESFKQNNFDLVLAKFGISEADDKGLVEELRGTDPDCIIIGIVEDSNYQLSQEMENAGLYAIAHKPINSEKLFILIQKGAQLHSLACANRKLSSSLQEQNNALQKQNTLLAKRIEESTTNLTRLYEDLRSTYMRTIKALAEAIDARDHYTHSHSENVAKFAVIIAQEMHLCAKDIEFVREACELHDLGKIGIADRILLKASSLTPEEWIEIKHNPQTGAQILEPLAFLDEVVEMVRQHHERFDGSGYPAGKKGEDILLGARIIHLADAYDSMTSARSYRQVPLTKEEAVMEIKKNTGTQFDPAVAQAFLNIVDKL